MECEEPEFINNIIKELNDLIGMSVQDQFGNQLTIKKFHSNIPSMHFYYYCLEVFENNKVYLSSELLVNKSALTAYINYQPNLKKLVDIAGKSEIIKYSYWEYNFYKFKSPENQLYTHNIDYIINGTVFKVLYSNEINTYCIPGYDREYYQTIEKYEYNGNFFRYPINILRYILNPDTQNDYISI